MAKTIKFEMSAKDVKTIAAAAEILQRIVTPAEEPVIAVIEEAPVKKAKKAEAKKATKKVEKPAEKPAAKPAKKASKKTTLKKITVSTKHRITLPRTYLDATGAFALFSLLIRSIS